MLESLEARRLLAVTASLAANGTLNVMSDHASDQVTIRINDHSQIVVEAGLHHGVFAASVHSVTSIQVDLGAGDDSLTTDLHINVPMTIHGGIGNDHITAGSGHDMIFGDDGDDAINSADGATDTVNGGAGNDTATVDHVDIVTDVEHVNHPHHGHDLFYKELAFVMNDVS